MNIKLNGKVIRLKKIYNQGIIMYLIVFVLNMLAFLLKETQMQI